MPTVTVDHVENVAVESERCPNELRTIRTLTDGLCWLTGILKRRESRWQAQNGGKFSAVSSFGLDIDGTQKDLDKIACSFHWFGVSICNLARLVGFIRGLSTGEFTRSDLRDKTQFRKIKSSVDSYVDRIAELAEVLRWRNKVAAHFAITDPFKDDNIATLDMSVIFPVSFDNGFYNVGEMALIRSGLSGTHTSELPCWSLTKVFESLIPRYWPGLTFVPNAAPAEVSVPESPQP